MSYIRFSFDTKKLGLKEPCIRIYPLPCMHLGAPQCDVQFLREHIARISRDPNARWVYMGDGGECVTKYSKGDVYGQLMSPQLQLECLVDLLTPIKDKALFGIRGNHGHRVYKETGLSFDHSLCKALGIPYMGVGTFCNLIVNRSSYDLFFHHGIDSGISLRVKIQAAEAFMLHINADAVFTAHSHIAQELTPAAIEEADNYNCCVRTKLRQQYICGTAYDSRTGYAEDKGFPPLLPAYLAVAFDGRVIEGHASYSQSCQVWRSDGKHALRHEYLLKYLTDPERRTE